MTRDQVKYAKPDPDLFLAVAANSMRRSKRQLSSVTRSGTCWRPGAAAASVSACSLAVTARRSWSEPALPASTKTPPICSSISMKLAAGDRCRPGVGITVYGQKPAATFSWIASS